jgi:hypothetical protein
MRFLIAMAFVAAGCGDPTDSYENCWSYTQAGQAVEECCKDECTYDHDGTTNCSSGCTCKIISTDTLVACNDAH